MSTTQHNTTLMRVPVSQVERLQRTGSPFSGKSYVNEFGIGAVEMAGQAEAVLSPWYSTDGRSRGARSCTCLLPASPHRALQAVWVLHGRPLQRCTLLHLPAPCQPTQGVASCLGTPRTAAPEVHALAPACSLPAHTGRCKLSGYSTDGRSKGARSCTCLLPASPHRALQAV